MINYISFIFLCFLVNYLYYKILHKINFNEKKGIGVFLSIVPLFYFLVSYIYNINLNIQVYVFIFIIIVSFIYWIDDIKNLSASFRLLIQFLGGVTLFFIIYYNNDFNNITFYLIFLLLFGLWNIFLTNVINFYDGNDGNVSILMFLQLVFLLFYPFIYQDWNELIVYFILFILIFVFFNFYLKTYYFGDSGCLTFALIFNYLILNEIKYSESFSILLYMIPLILPIIDVLYVLFLRFYKEENLLTRNYHHLYQQIFLKYKGYYYLLPTFIFAILLLFINIIFLNNLYNVFIILVINFIIGTVLYFIIRYNNFFKEKKNIE